MSILFAFNPHVCANKLILCFQHTTAILPPSLSLSYYSSDRLEEGLAFVVFTIVFAISFAVDENLLAILREQRDIVGWRVEGRERARARQRASARESESLSERTNE